MNVEIRKYNPSIDYDGVLALVRSEGSEWKDYVKPTYRRALEQSITYVAVIDGEICGYSRSINDSKLFIWVIDLLVHIDNRGYSIGKQLMECIHNDYPNMDVYVMSDVDEYYAKLGYKKEGSIFKVSA